MPSVIGISNLRKDGVPDVITLRIENKKKEMDQGLCEILTGVGGAVAGLVNPVAGAIFGVGAVTCKAI